MDLHAKIAKTTKIATMLVCFGLVSGLVYKVYQWRQSARAEREARRGTRQADRKANREANHARFKEMAESLKLTKQQLESILASNAQKEPLDKAAQEAMTQKSSELLTALEKYIGLDSAQDAATQAQMKSLKDLVGTQTTLINDLKNTADNDKGKLDNINTDQKKVMEGIAALAATQLNTQGATKVQLEGLLFAVNLFAGSMEPKAIAEATELINNNKIAKDCITATQLNLTETIALYNRLLSQETQAMKTLEANLSNLKAKLSELEKTTLPQEEAKLFELKTALSQEKAKLFELKTALSQEKATLSDLTSKETSLPQEKELVQNEIEWIASEIKIATNEEKLSALKTRLLELQTKLSDLTSKETALPQEKESVQSKIAEIEHQIKDITSQIESTNKRIVESNTSIESLNAQIESTKNGTIDTTGKLITVGIKQSEEDIQSIEHRKFLIELIFKIALEILEAMKLYETKDNITNEGFLDHFATFYATLTKKHENEIQELEEIGLSHLFELLLIDGQNIMQANELIKKLPAVLILKLKRDIEAKIAQLSK